MRFTELFYPLAFIFAFVLPSNLTTQYKDSEIIESLNSVIRPIQTINPDSSFSDIQFLTETLKDRDIIALGEVTHGTHEVFVYKDRLIRFLITELGYKAISFESDFIAVQHYDDYINSKSDSLTFVSGFPFNRQTKTMLEWMKKYNQSKPAKDRVHIYGLEARGFSNVATEILNVLPQMSESNKAILLTLKELNYSSLKKNDISQVKSIIPALYSNAENSDQALLYVHYVKLLEQVVNRYLANNNFGARDQFMSENAKWILNNTTNRKLIIWAHNGHVAKSDLYNTVSLGGYLKQIYGSRYYVIATDFNMGYVNVFVGRNRQSVYYPSVTSNDSYEYYFKNCKYDNFIIDINACADNLILKALMKKKLEMRMIGGTEKPVNKKLSIFENFDLVVFFNQTTAG